MQYDISYELSEATGPGCVDLRIENQHKLEATGKPGFNWETRIVNDKGEDVAPGEVGELLVRGNGVMKEYYKNPEKNERNFKGWLEEEVNQFCEHNLPRYKRPRRIIFDKVPRNPTGKIEKPKLRQKYAGFKKSFRV